MKVTTEELGRCEILMTVEVEPAEEQKLLKKAAQRIAKQVQIPGFRPGKAPYNTVVRRYGLEAVQQEVLDKSSEKIIVDALQDAELEPQAPMSLEDVTWEPLTLKVKVPTDPVVELGDYRQIRLEGKTVEVTDEEVDKALETLREQNAAWVPVERAADYGDLLTFSAVEKDGDNVLHQEEAVEYELTRPGESENNGAERPDFTTPLLGLSAGESKTFTVNYPENWQAEQFAGKEITFEVEVVSVKEKELDPLDDDFAKSMGDFETLEALKEQVRASIVRQHQQEVDHELGQKVLHEVVEGATIEWPAALEEYRLDQEIERVERQLKQSNLTLASYLQMQNKTADTFREESRERVVQELKIGLVLNELSKLERLDVSQIEILQRAKAIAEFSGAGDQFWQSVLSSHQSQATIGSDILTGKVFSRLAAIARGEAPELDAEPEVEEVTGETEAADEASPETVSLEEMVSSPEVVSSSEEISSSEVVSSSEEISSSEVVSSSEEISSSEVAPEAVLPADEDELGE